MKKIAVIVYPHFSLYEVTCLTEALMWFDQSVEIFASSKEPVRSEDGFLVTADKTLDEFSAGDYACVVLPGMMIPFPALFDRKLIDFLASLKGKELLIAAISAGPMLLAKAGLLEDATSPPASGRRSARTSTSSPTRTSCTGRWSRRRTSSQLSGLLSGNLPRRSSAPSASTPASPDCSAASTRSLPSRR